MSHPNLASAPGKGFRALGALCLGVVAVGVMWRVIRYLAGFPIWGDEAMLLVNLIDRDYAGLMSPLDHAQVAPLLFLWAEKTVLLAIGSAEQSLRLVPFLAGLAGLFVFWQACRANLPPAVAGLALAILAVSYYPIRHSVEVKPYALDLLFAATFIWLALGHLRQQGSLRWLMALTVLAPLAMWWSYPAVFVAASAAVVLLPRLRTSPWSERALYLLFLVLLGGSFFLHYSLVGLGYFNGGPAPAAGPLLDHWRNAFPPDEIADWPLWLVGAFTGNMLAYPAGGKNWGSTLTFLLTVIGTVSLWRRARNGAQEAHSLLALCWLPVALTLAAACLHRYPFGDSARVSLHMAPSIVILMALGLDQAINWPPSQNWRSRWRNGVLASLLVFGVAGVARDVASPYKTKRERDVRALVRDLTRDVGAGESMRLCHRPDEGIPASLLWYIRTQPWNTNWNDTRLAGGAASCWVLQCGYLEPTSADLLACVGEDTAGWAVAERHVGSLPSDSAVRPLMYCGWSRLVRAR